MENIFLNKEKGRSSALGVRNIIKAYLFSLMLLVAAVLVRILLNPYLYGTLSHPTIFLVVLLSAWYFGTGPALLNIMLGYPAIEYTVLPSHPYEGFAYWMTSLSLYTFLSAAIVLFVSRLRRKSAALEESKRKLAIIADYTFDWEFWLSPEGKFIYSSPSCFPLTGYDAEDFKADPGLFRRLIHPDDRALYDEHRGDSISAACSTEQVEFRLIRRDGSRIWINHFCRAIFDDDGRFLGVRGSNRDITKRKLAEEALRKSEEQVREKLNGILSPKGDIGSLNLKDIIDTPAIQSLMDDFYEISGIPMAVIDLEGTVLVGVGWQDVCVKFHRSHPEACKFCIESDTALTSDVPFGEFRLYKCKNHMWDVSTPLVVGDRHLGNLFIGQFFFDDEEVDLGLFREQARKFGFDEKQYISALKTVPRLSREAARAGMSFLTKLGEMISQLSYSNVRLARALSERQSLIEEAEAAKISALKAKQAAETANSTKDQFLAVLSHELRTPLTPVLAAVSLMEKGGGGGMLQTKALEIIRRNVELEARLIDDLLDLTRIARGKIVLERRPVAISEVLQSVAETCKPDIEGKNLLFSLDIENGTSLVNGDSSRLQQVFWNLVKNSVKFTSEGGSVGVACFDRGERVVVEVRDNGIGIESDALPKIFKAFEQADKKVTLQFGGLGLGLAISERLVTMHGGTIVAESPGKGQGATFRVELPLMPGRETGVIDIVRESVEAGRKGPFKNGSSRRILLVEDHSDTAFMMQNLLETSGHKVTRAGDVAEALEAVKGGSFDLLISDLGLPDRSGLELMEELRRLGNPLKGIAVSGFGQEEDLRRSKEAGFVEHLTKPVDLEALNEAVERAV